MRTINISMYSPSLVTNDARRLMHRAVQASTLIVLCVVLAGCYVDPYPERLANSEEVFVPQDLGANFEGIPSDSKKKAQFEAPFEDVWRAVTMGATQAQLNIDTSQKPKGLILAHRITKNSNPMAAYLKNRYTYAILVKELGPKTSEVILLARIQQECNRKLTPAGWVSSVLQIPIFGVGFLYIMMNNDCERMAQIQWARSEEELNQVVVFTRNNLMAAGAL